jgi:hypothetical protein
MLVRVMTYVMMQDGDSCLMKAVRSGNLDVVKYLCEVGGKELIMLQNKVWQEDEQTEGIDHVQPQSFAFELPNKTRSPLIFRL